MIPADEPPLHPPPDLTGWLGRRGRLLTSPAARCRVPGAAVEPRLGPWDLGSWTGRPLDGLDLTAWRADPAYAGHGGESLAALAERVGALLANLHGRLGRTGRTAAVTHGAVVKLAVVLALRAPLEAVWSVEAAPGSATELHPAGAGWRLVGLNRPLPAGPDAPQWTG